MMGCDEIVQINNIVFVKYIPSASNLLRKQLILSELTGKYLLKSDIDGTKYLT